ncbi:MAG: LptF/LptG family permease [Planctomycetota bacterium]
MKKIDTYIMRLFAAYFSAALVGFLTMFVVVDISGRVGGFARTGAFLKAFLLHYMEEIPLLLNLILPIVAVLSAIFVLLTLKRRNELVCLQSSGVSIHRVLRPIIFAMAAIVPVFYLNSELVIPAIAARRDPPGTGAVAAVVTGSHVGLATADSVDSRTGKARDLNFMIIGRTSGVLEFALFTTGAAWDAQTRRWVFDPRDVIIGTGDRTSVDAAELPALIARFDPLLFPSPARLAIASRPPSHLGLRDLAAIMPNRHAQIEAIHRLCFPWLIFLMLLAVVPFATGGDRQVPVFLGVGVGLGVVFLFYGVAFGAMFMGGKGLIGPWTAGLAPLLVFTIPAILVYRKVRT